MAVGGGAADRAAAQDAGDVDAPDGTCASLLENFAGIEASGGDPAILSAAFARDGCIVPLVERWRTAADALDVALYEAAELSAEVARLNADIADLNGRIAQLEGDSPPAGTPTPVEESLGQELLDRMAELLAALDAFESAAPPETSENGGAVPDPVAQGIAAFAQALAETDLAGACDIPRIERGADTGVGTEASGADLILRGSVATPEDFNTVVDLARQIVGARLREALELRPGSEACFIQVGEYQVRLTDDGALLTSDEAGIYERFLDILPEATACDEINALLQNDPALAEWRAATPETERGAWVRSEASAYACAWTARGYGTIFQPGQQRYLVMEPSS